MLTDHFLEHNSDIIAITETWLGNTPRHKKAVGDVTPLGYDFLHTPRSNKGGGGVAILHKESIKRKDCAHPRLKLFVVILTLLEHSCQLNLLLFTIHNKAKRTDQPLICF